MIPIIRKYKAKIPSQKGNVITSRVLSKRLLAFENTIVINNAKFIILTASLVAGILGYLFLKFTLKDEVVEIE